MTGPGGTLPAEAPPRLLFATDTGGGQGIPYVDLFYEALAPYGVELIRAPIEAEGRWLARQGKGVGVLHAQWPEDLWRVHLRALRGRAPWLFRLPLVPRALTTALGAYRFAGFVRFVRAAKRAGVRLVWTLHNFEAHEGAGPFDRAGYRVLAGASDLIICHCEWAKGECLDRHSPPGEVVVMSQGNYDGVYPAPRPRGEVLAGLGLRDDLPAVCCLGGLRDYKGIDVACEAVARLGGRVQLIVAGPPHEGHDLEGLRRRIGAIPGAVLVPRRLTDGEFSDLVAAGEAVLLPYRRITTSALLLAALTLGRGVVASDLPYLREVLARGPGAGLLVPPGDPAALAGGIESFLAIPGERRAKAARDLADQFAWAETIRPVARVVERWRHRP